MRENKRLNISVEKGVCSCNSCMKRNYDCEKVEDKVDKIFKITVGQMVVYLCPECLKELEDLIEYNI